MGSVAAPDWAASRSAMSAFDGLPRLRLAGAEPGVWGFRSGFGRFRTESGFVVEEEEGGSWVAGAARERTAGVATGEDSGEAVRRANTC